MISTVSAEAPDLAWRFALDNEEKIAGRLDQSQKLTFMPGLLSTSADALRADELKAYAEKTYPSGFSRGSLKEEAAIRQRAITRRLRLPEIDQWLAAHGEASR